MKRLLARRRQIFSEARVARELERAVAAKLIEILSPKVLPTPSWLMRPGKVECRTAWDLVRQIYRDMTDLELPDVMRSVERRTVDLVFQVDGQPPRILEFDETQHFNRLRAMTLRRYPDEAPVAFDVHEWIRRSDAKMRLEGGGFAKPKPPLFPEEGGRHKQRAFRDALCDLLPPRHGYLPTLRIGYFEVETWIHGPAAEPRFARLLEEHFALAAGRP